MAAALWRHWLRRLNSKHLIAIHFATDVGTRRTTSEFGIDRHNNKMIAGYIMVFWAVYALLPLAIDASMACNAPGSMTNAVTQKAENGSALCATSAPTKTVAADIKLLCLDACLRHASCEDGFNYHEETKLCEMYSDQPTNYQVQPNCSYVKVRRRLIRCLYLADIRLQSYVDRAYKSSILRGSLIFQINDLYQMVSF